MYACLSKTNCFGQLKSLSGSRGILVKLSQVAGHFQHTGELQSLNKSAAE